LQYQAVLRLIQNYCVLLCGPLFELPNLFLSFLLVRDWQQSLEFLDNHIEAAPRLIFLVDMQWYKSEVMVFLHQASGPKNLGLQSAISIDHEADTNPVL